MNKEVEEKLNSINKTLQEILKWTRFANLHKLIEILKAELDSGQKKLAYENSDGVNTLKMLVELSGAPHRTIHGWWIKWFSLGIVIESEKRKGRMMKIVSLDNVGIQVPKKAMAAKQNEIDEQIQESDSESS